MATRILVTGAGGFIGRALVASLKASSAEVIELRSADGDIAEAGTLERHVDRGISRVFHLAGKTGVPESWASPHLFFRTNVLGTANVLEFCRRGRIPLTCVSGYVYGRPRELPITEDCPPDPNNPYAQSKWLAEQCCGFYSLRYDLPVVVIRPFNVYGPGQDERFLIPTLVRQALEEPVIQVKDLEPRRDFIHINDLIHALHRTASCPGGYHVYNIGSGSSLSVAQVIEVIQKAAGTSKRVVCTNAVRDHEIPDTVACIDKASRELDWRPQHTFEEGIAALIQAERRPC